MNRFAVLLVPALLISPVSTSFAQSFGYFGEIGPDFWSDLDEDNFACTSGDRQSPVDLGKQRVYPHLKVDYDTATHGEIFNNGHTIEVETEGDNTLWLDGKTYELAQFHFHTASEHRIQGRGYDMELHLVHKDDDGEIAVIGVFLTRGDTSGPLAPIFMSLPEIEGELNSMEELADPFNPLAFLPDSKKHFRYSGSLTTPPCTEGVKWVVMLEPVTVLDEDMAQFAARISFNARYTQREVPARR